MQTAEQRKASNRRYYLKTKERHAVARHASRQRARQYILQIKEDNECIDCGEENPLALQFDHIPGRGKLGHIGWMAARGWGVKRLSEEIAKCELVCANCHLVRTHNRRQVSMAKLDKATPS